MKKITIVLTTFVLLSGCTIPRAGFKSRLINQDDPHYRMVEVTPELKLSDADTAPKTIVDPIFAGNNWHWTSLAKGDVLHITILSSGGAGYLSNNASGDRADFENILVTDSNIVQVPYAGTIPVTGLDVTQLAEEIRERLSRVVLNPQVLITLTARTGAMVTIEGSGKTGRYPLEQSMNRLSHFLATAGVENTSADMMEVHVTRQQHYFNARLSDIYQYPALDIALQPDDRITLRQVTEYVNVLGAAGVQGKHALVQRHSSIVDALALAKGLNDNLADPQAVFLYKHNEAEQAKQQMRKPNIYHVDMSLPDSFFLAQAMRVEDGDIIYISNASLTDFAKVKAAFDSFLIRGSNSF